MQIDLETMLKRAHNKLLMHEDTRLYAGTILLGKNAIDEDFPTAYTDGINKFYGRGFMSKQDEANTIGVVLHENLHVVLKHLPRHTALWKKNAKLTNAAADYVVNGLIHKLAGYGSWIKLPDPHLYDAKFDGWSVYEIYRFLDTGVNKDGEDEGKEQSPGESASSQDQPSNDKSEDGTPDSSAAGDSDSDSTEDDGKVTIGGTDYSTESQDEHDFEAMANATEEELREINDKVNEAINQAGIFAGLGGKESPRELLEALAQRVDYRKELIEFATTNMKGNAEYTWRSFNKRRVADEYYMPSTHDERLSEMVVAIDTSASITPQLISEFGESIVSACEACTPDKVRILWWDTEVHGEQVFEDNFHNIKSMLKPMGGGGTQVSCVSQYIKDKNIAADCMLVFTDGYLEHDITWDITIPTLWLVTENARFVPPRGGRKLVIEQ